MIIPHDEVPDRLLAAREVLARSSSPFAAHAGAELSTAPGEVADWLVASFARDTIGTGSRDATGLYVEANRFDSNPDGIHLGGGLVGPPPGPGRRTVISREFDEEVGEFIGEVPGTFHLDGIGPLLDTFREHGTDPEDADLAVDVVRLDLFRLLGEAHADGGLEFRLAAALHDEHRFVIWPPNPGS